MLKRNPILIIFAVVLFSGVLFFLLNKFVFNKKIELKKEEKSGNINILLLGKGGGVHEGPDLTDTMMVATINPDKNMVNLISIPRDLWAPDLQAKINTAYSTGQERGKQGKLLSKSIVGKVTGKQIDYVLAIDFSGFVKMVDYLGGVDVNVEKTLDDYEYPIEGKEDDPCGHPEEELETLATASSQLEAFPCRYRRIHFDQGIVHMNGQEALEFIRSRHGLNGQGSDFARSQRQQSVINAIKNKALSLGVILNPLKVLGVFNIIKDNIDMDARLNEIDDFINLANKMQNAKIISTVIDYGDGERQGLLIHPPISEAQKLQWILIPRSGDGNFSEIKDYLICIEEGNICTISEDGIIKEDTPN